MEKKYFVLGMVVVIVISIVFYILCYPIVLIKNKKVVLDVDISKTVFNPLENANLLNNNSVAYILSSKADMQELPRGISKSKLLECRDKEVLQNLKKFFVFKKTGGDMTTCESYIYIYSDDKIILHSNFVLTDSVIGIQNNIVGWADAIYPDSLKNIFIEFKPVNIPIKKL